MTDDSSSPIWNHLSRRQFVGASTATTLALAGCVGGDDDADDGNDAADTDDPTVADGDQNGAPEADGATPDLPRVEDPPDAVYLPTHRESVVMLDTKAAGDYRLLPHFTYPHLFWLVTDDQTQEVQPVDLGVHMMFAVWDAETEQILPVDTGAEMETRLDGEVVDQRVPWPMLSQQMGFHFGDNVRLTENGTYEVEVTLNPIDVRKTGAFAGRFDEQESTTFEFEFDAETRQQMVAGVEYLDEGRWGERDALEPMSHGHGMDDGMNHGDGDDGMDHGNGDDGMDGHENGEDMDHGHGEVPSGMLPPAEEYPGQDLGVHTSGDAHFVVRYFADSRLAEGDAGYLLVSPRTPYNRYPLPDMALSVAGDIEGELVQTLDDELGHHYGRSVTLDGGDQFDLVVESPPQIARHRGYETAFLDMPSMDVETPADIE